MDERYEKLNLDDAYEIAISVTGPDDKTHTVREFGESGPVELWVIASVFGHVSDTVIGWREE